MSYDDDDDLDDDRSDTWVPPPPLNDDYEDPNPRPAASAPTPPVRLAPVIPLRSKRQEREELLASRVRQIIEDVGVADALGALLDQASREKVEVETTCRTCDHAMAPFYGRCPRCQGNANRERVERMAEAIRDLKSLAVAGDPDPEREREIVAQLREYEHPDLDGLLRWCAATRERADRAGVKDAGKARRW